MHKHYHVLLGPADGPSMAEGIIDNYEDSVVIFTNMTRSMFGHLFQGESEITLERVMEHTENDEVTSVGTSSLCAFWFACDDCKPFNVN